MDVKNSVSLISSTHHHRYWRWRRCPWITTAPRAEGGPEGCECVHGSACLLCTHEVCMKWKLRPWVSFWNHDHNPPALWRTWREFGKWTTNIVLLAGYQRDSCSVCWSVLFFSCIFLSGFPPFHFVSLLVWCGLFCLVLSAVVSLNAPVILFYVNMILKLLYSPIPLEGFFLCTASSRIRRLWRSYVVEGQECRNSAFDLTNTNNEFPHRPTRF